MTFCVILSTASNENVAKYIAKQLLEEKLAACINMVPKITSMYVWNDELVEDEEVLMVVKTKKDLFERAKDCIIKNHTYDVPEVISLPIEAGSKSYLDWIMKETSL